MSESESVYDKITTPDQTNDEKFTTEEFQQDEEEKQTYIMTGGEETIPESEDAPDLNAPEITEQKADDSEADVMQSQNKSTDQNFEGMSVSGTAEPTSPEPEYTPPESATSWSTADEANKTVDVPLDDKPGADDNTDVTPTDRTTADKQQSDMTKEMKDFDESLKDGESGISAMADNPETSETQANQEPEKSDETVPPDTPKAEEPTRTVTTEEETQKSDKDHKQDDFTATKGAALATKELEAKIKENEELQLKLESTLSNQAAEREAYQKLINENATLQKHHDDMKIKCEEIQGGHVLMEAELESLKKVNKDQSEEISKLKTEVHVLKDTQGGDENVKDLQEKLIRLANEQEEKDRRIHSLQAELDDAKDKLKDAESRAARNGGATGADDNPKSKTCVVM